MWFTVSFLVAPDGWRGVFAGGPTCRQVRWPGAPVHRQVPF